MKDGLNKEQKLQGPNKSRRYEKEVARIHRRTIQKGPKDADIHDGVIPHLEPDILDCKVKWALGSITMNKASGSDGIPAELFQILKYDVVKVLHSICQEIWKIQQWSQDWKRSVFIPIPKKGHAKECSNNWSHFTYQQSNAQNTPSQASTVHETRTPRCSSWIRGTREQIMKICLILEKSREFQKNIYFCFID